MLRRMTHPEPRLIPLPSGLTLAVAEYGVPDGVPVFFFHGWPSARMQGALFHEAALGVGVRVLAVDRPGVGKSTPQANRRLVDWPPLLRELAAALALDRVRVLGVSGGGPYALASAWGAPELVEAAAVVCGAPPLTELGPDGLTLAYRIMLAAHGRSRKAMRLFFRILHPLAAARAPEWMMTMLRGAVRGPDKAVLADGRLAQLCYDGFRYAWGGHRDGVFEDAEIYTQPWGFALEEVRRPVRMWHGTEDHNFSYHLAERVAARLPNCALRIVPDEGHYSLPIRHAREILADLIATPASSPDEVRHLQRNLPRLVA
jgi:pimeloyl-ACP methyl ester carboxylesterase